MSSFQSIETTNHIPRLVVPHSQKKTTHHSTYHLSNFIAQRVETRLEQLQHSDAAHINRHSAAPLLSTPTSPTRCNSNTFPSRFLLFSLTEPTLSNALGLRRFIVLRNPGGFRVALPSTNTTSHSQDLASVVASLSTTHRSFRAQFGE